MKRNKLFSNVISSFLAAVKILSVLIFAFFVVLYVIIQPLNKKSAGDMANFTQDTSKEEFIEQLTPYAQEVSASHGVRPSLLVAQAALESNWGKSQLAQESNNYFGIKNPEGKEYVTKEFTQSEWIEIHAAFRQYASAYDSVVDYANLLKNGTSWNQDLYQEVIDAPTYKDAAQAIAQAGYATDPQYADKIIQIIESYQLNKLDNL